MYTDRSPRNPKRKRDKSGSHRWNKLYRAITPDHDEAFMDETLELCPRFHDEFDNPDYRFLSWDLEPGDVIVQRGTNHAWANRSDAPCRICFILIDGKFDEGA